MLVVDVGAALDLLLEVGAGVSILDDELDTLGFVLLVIEPDLDVEWWAKGTSVGVPSIVVDVSGVMTMIEALVIVGDCEVRVVLLTTGTGRPLIGFRLADAAGECEVELGSAGE